MKTELHRRRRKIARTAAVALMAGALLLQRSGTVRADSSYHDLTSGSFRQDWSDTQLISANDDWSRVPAIAGYRGDDLTGGTGTNPGTITGASTVVNVIANQTAPNTLASGGVAEFQLDNPVIALNGSGTADAPHLVLHLNASGRKQVTIAYNLRDLDSSADNTNQQVALQFRVGNSGDWINVPAGFVADATTGPDLATMVTPVNAELPAEANNASQLQVRIITTNAPGNDEWVGIDDIVVSSLPCDGPCPTGGTGPVVISQIHEIQGPGLRSPLAGQTITTQGIVTARARNGFFLQSPPNESDVEASTSQGVFVFTSTAPPAIAAIGDMIRLTATVVEFGRVGDTNEDAPTLTELTQPGRYERLIDGDPASLPPPVALTGLDLSPAAPFDRLERYEGMRITVPATVVVAPTSRRASNSTFVSDGQFYVTLPGVAHPYRQPGIEAHVQIALNQPALSSSQANPAAASVPRFDTNPEVLRIDTEELFAYDGQRTPGVTAAVGASVASFTGVLHYEERTYTALPTVATAAAVSGLLTKNTIVPVVPIPTPSAAQFTIGHTNLEFFSSTGADYPTRKIKVVRAICDTFKAPDILGVIEVANLASLEDLVSGGSTNLNNYPGCNGATYRAYLDSPDNATQNTGVLVKERAHSDPRVTVLEHFRNNTAEGGIPVSVNDRRPYILRATVSRPGTNPIALTVIVNHLRSLIGVDDPNNTIARTKKLDQSRYLAGLVDRLQTEDPWVNLALVGDFNTFEFSEGYIDAIGLIKGNPEPDDARTYATGDSIDLYDPDLINLITLPAFPASERYTYSFIGDRQVLDHILVNQNLYRKLRGFAIAHVNSNYPEIDPATGTSLREDPTRPERFSDHDSPFGYFGFTTPALSSDFEVEQSGLLFDPTLQAYTGYLTIRNVGPFTINGPLQIALTAPVPGVSFLNRTGITADGSYYTLDASLAPGESRIIDVQIRNSAGIPPVYSANVYTGVF